MLERNRTAGVWIASVLTSLGALLPVAAGAQAEGRVDPLDKLEVEKGQLAWDGIALGTSLVRAERLLGVTLAVEHGTGESPCATWVATADRNGLTLTMGFASPKPGAKIEWLRVRFEGNQILASSTDLVASLHRHVPDATWVQPADTASVEEDLRPVFTVPAGKETQAVQFAPREWMVLAKAACVG